jgi:hypothetical protein
MASKKSSHPVVLSKRAPPQPYQQLKSDLPSYAFWINSLERATPRPTELSPTLSLQNIISAISSTYSFYRMNVLSHAMRWIFGLCSYFRVRIAFDKRICPTNSYGIYIGVTNKFLKYEFGHPQPHIFLGHVSNEIVCEDLLCPLVLLLME